MCFRVGALGMGMYIVIAAGCGPKPPGETEGGTGSGETSGGVSTTSTTSAASSTSTEGGTTGAARCELAVGPNLEPPERDPAGCFEIEDEQGCLAKGDACTGLYGVPARCEGEAEWCAPDLETSTFLGCRPFTICKLSSKMVCTMFEDGVQAFWTQTCMPEGFGACEPGSGEQPPVCAVSP